MRLQCVCHNTMPWLISFSLDGERTVKRKTRVWLLAIAILVLIATTYGILAIYFTPPNYLSTSRMKLEGRLTIGPEAMVIVPPPERRHAVTAVVITATYVPGLTL